MRFTNIRCVCLVVLATAAVLHSQSRARISQLVGKVEVRTANAASWRQARIDMPVSEKHDIRTFVESEAELTFDNGTKLKIGENSVVTLSRLTADAASGSSKSTVKIGTGAVWANVKKLTESRSEFDFETPTAVASIRGTHLGIKVDKRKTTVDVFEGLVAVSKKGSRRSVNVSANNRAVVDRDKKEVAVVDFKKVEETQRGDGASLLLDPYGTPPAKPDSLPVVNDSGTTVPETKSEQGRSVPEIEDPVEPAVGQNEDEEAPGESVEKAAVRKLFLTLVSPASDAVIHSPLIVVTGKTVPDAKVYVNELQVVVGSDGSFKHTLPLPDEPYRYTVEVRAENEGGEQTVSRQVTYEVPKQKLFLDVASPADGAVITGKVIRISGRTATDATVNVNGKSLSVSANGMFSGEIPVFEKNIGEYTLDIGARNEEDEIVKSLTLDISAKSPQINTSSPVAVFPSAGILALTQNIMTVQVLDRTPQDEVTVTYANNGSTDVINSTNGRTEKLLLDEGSNRYLVQVTDLAGNSAPPIKGNVYYLPGPIKLLLQEPSALHTVYDGLPPVLHPGRIAAEEAVAVEVEIDDGIGTVPESIRYCKVVGNGQTVILRNNNDYIYTGKVNVVRGTNVFTVQAEDLSNRLETLKFTIVVK